MVVVFGFKQGDVKHKKSKVNNREDHEKRREKGKVVAMRVSTNEDWRRETIRLRFLKYLFILQFAPYKMGY